MGPCLHGEVKNDTSNPVICVTMAPPPINETLPGCSPLLHQSSGMQAPVSPKLTHFPSPRFLLEPFPVSSNYFPCETSSFWFAPLGFPAQWPADCNTHLLLTSIQIMFCISINFLTQKSPNTRLYNMTRMSFLILSFCGNWGKEKRKGNP